MAPPIITIHDDAGDEFPPGTGPILPPADPGVETAPTVIRVRNNSIQGPDVDPARNLKMLATARLAGSVGEPQGSGLAVLDDRIVRVRITGATNGAVVTGALNTTLTAGTANIIELGEIPGSAGAGYGEIELELTVFATVNASGADSEVIFAFESRQTFPQPTGRYEATGNFVISGSDPPLPDFTALRRSDGLWSASGTDTITTPTLEQYVFLGELFDYFGPTITFDDLDGSAVALTPGNEYRATVSLTDGGTVSIVKGDQAPLTSAIAPDPPTGDIRRVEVVVPFGLVINDITIFDALAFFGFVDLGGLSGRITRGKGFSGGFLVLADTDTDFVLADDAITRIYVDPATGSPELVVQPGDPSDPRAMPIWEITTAGGSITITTDLRQIGPGIGATSMDPALAQVKGLLGDSFNENADWKRVSFNGSRDDVPVANFVPLHFWTVPTPPLSFVDPPADMVVFSNSANDTAAGSGARTIEVMWVDSAGDEQITPVTLNGQTEVPLGLGYAVNDMRLLTAGATRFNEGNIWVTDVGSGGIPGAPAVAYGAIGDTTTFTGGSDAAPGVSLMGHYLIPNGYIGVIFEARLTTEDPGQGRIRYRLPTATSSESVSDIVDFATLTANSPFVATYGSPRTPVLPSGTWVTAWGSVDGAGTDRVEVLAQLHLQAGTI